MNVLDPSVIELTEQNPWRRIEIAGRTCYNSLSKTTDTSAKPFVNGLINRGHYTPLEVARVYIPKDLLDTVPDVRDKVYKYAESSQTNLASGILSQGNSVHCTVRFMALTGMPIEWLDKPDVKMYNDYKTFIIVADRGTANQFVRHRSLCYDDNGEMVSVKTSDSMIDEMPMVQESTRYCNYDKHGFSVVRPYPFEWAYEGGVKYEIWKASCENAYLFYLNLLHKRCKPQEARTVLPLSTATKVVMSGTFAQWREFVKLRLAPDADPQARLIAAGVWSNIRKQMHDLDITGLETKFDIWSDELIDKHLNRKES